MQERTRILAVVGFTVLLFLGIQFGALLLVEPLDESGRQAVENPDDPTNSVLYVGVIVVATAFMLGAFRYGAQRLIQVVIVGVSVLLSWFVLVEVLPDVASPGGVHILATGGAVVIGVTLYWYPEWYVIDAAGVLMGAGAAGLFGISLGLLPAVVFLAVLAVYDAISVYRTEHMLDLAGEVLDLRLPVVLVIPTTRSFSYLPRDDGTDAGDDGTDGDESSGVGDAGPGDGPSSAGPEDGPPAAGTGAASDVRDGDPGERSLNDRDALFVGLGDAVIPTILVASSAHFLPVARIDVPAVSLTVPALGAIGGTLAGLLVLLYFVMGGRPHAGLPLLNGGAIGGYLLGAMASGVSIVTALGL